MLLRYNTPGEKAQRGDGPYPGDILLFFRPARKRDYIIQMFTNSPFYHAALYAGEGQVIEARPRGVARNDLRGREENFVVAPAPEGKGAEALAWAETRIGDAFNRNDMLVIALEHLFTHWDINYTTPNEYTCAEFVTTAYQHAGVRLFPDLDLDEVAPANLAAFL